MKDFEKIHNNHDSFKVLKFLIKPLYKLTFNIILRQFGSMEEEIYFSPDFDPSNVLSYYPLYCDISNEVKLKLSISNNSVKYVFCLASQRYFLIATDVRDFSCA